jgi:outer membrane protein OmpA-like peptidoglycan-associated protein/tetratricopeptide (TPR) repeat protein
MKTLLRKTFVLSTLIFCFLPAFSQVQSKKALIKAVQEADVYYYYDQNYEKASVLYEDLLNKNPENSNLMAKLGICYLNIDGKNADALKMLSTAKLNIVENDKDYTEFGEKAPLDTYLYLAIAYHHNDSLEKAIGLYYDAKKKLSGTKIFREEYIDNQIRDCRYAIEMKKKALTIDTELFAGWLNEYPGASNPALAKNDSVFVFTQKLNGKTRILCSYKSGVWKKPVDITKQLGGFDRFYSNSITGNGKMLIVYMDDGGDGNLYYSERRDSTWTKIKSVGKPINTIYWQSHGFITPDAKGMYFSSNKPGGEGELDIWYSEKDKSGKWQEPVNCGNIINTPYNEDTPFWDPDNSALLFSSVGHMSMGGYDVFRSIKKNGGWTNPVGMPYAFNNTDQNTFFILNNHKPGFITSLYNKDRDERNIYAVVAEDPAEKITQAKGRIKLQDDVAIDPKQADISLVDLKKKDTPKHIDMIDSSSFNFDVKPGDYQLYVSYTGYKTDTVNLSIPLYFEGNYIDVNTSLIPDKVFNGQFLSINNVYFGFDSCAISAEAKAGLDVLRSILISYPELKVEVAGYTDAMGSKEYNRILADKRAQAVIDYLSTEGTTAGRFVKKAYGKSNFVALNTNRDGSDNAEGRKYNRRVTFGIIDPKTGIVITQETYTPEHLRQPFSFRYSIVLLKSAKKLSPSYFSALTKDDLLFIRTIETDSLSMYALGVFYNKIDAIKYLDYARGAGFPNAYVLDQYQLENETKGLGTSVEKKTPLVDQNAFTIQLKATRNPINVTKIFNELEGVKEKKTSDGYYKYYYGEYESIVKAREALVEIKKAYNDAFVKNLYLLLTQ